MTCQDCGKEAGLGFMQCARCRRAQVALGSGRAPEPLPELCECGKPRRHSGRCKGTRVQRPSAGAPGVVVAAAHPAPAPEDDPESSPRLEELVSARAQELALLDRLIVERLRSTDWDAIPRTKLLRICGVVMEAEA